MFLINDNDNLDISLISNIIQQFQLNELPVLQKWYNYFIGKQAILSKPDTNSFKPCNKIVSNYCSTITTAYNGYITGRDITYSSDEDISVINDILKYNDVAEEDSTYLKEALIFGRAYEICYIDEDGKQRMKTIDPRECIPVYSSGLGEELRAVIRFYSVPNIETNTISYYVDIYEDTQVRHYASQNDYMSLEFIGSEPNYYGMVPITVFDLNDEKESIFNKVIGLQDAYNTLISSSVDDFESFADAYLIVNGVELTTEQVQQIRENRIFNFYGDGEGSVEYLIKDIKTTQIENLLDRIDTKIHTVANCPDFTDEAFGTSSGIAMRYKLLGFENAASAIEKKMVKALQRRIELFCSILYLTGTNDEMWRDIKITFHRNLPLDYSELIQEVKGLKDLVSDKTLLSQIPFIKDVDDELELLEKQREQEKLNSPFYQTVLNYETRAQSRSQGIE